MSDRITKTEMQFRVTAGQMFCGTLHVINRTWIDLYGRLRIEQPYHYFTPVNGQPFHASLCHRKLNNYASLNLQRIGKLLHWQ